jgi:hypothetical protein
VNEARIDADETSGAPTPEPETAPHGAATTAVRSRGPIWRWTRRILLVFVAVIAALIYTTFTIDISRFEGLRTRAEAGASAYLKRPARIGAIRAKLTPGVFTIDDFVIEGLTPEARPFFSAKRITVSLSWRTLLERELVLDVTLDDWTMTVEKWADGRTNTPRLRPEPRPPGPKRLRKTTVNFVHARNGEFAFFDHGMPWRVVAPNLNFSLVPYGGHMVGLARFNGGTVAIQDFTPMAASLATRFSLEGGLVKLQHIDLLTDGAESHITGLVDFTRWPDQTYNVSSTVDLSRMKAIFFPRERWTSEGEAEFRGVFRILKQGGQTLGGVFEAESVRVSDTPFRHLHGTLEWDSTHFAVTHADADVLGGRTRFAYAIAPLGTKTGSTHRFTADYDDVDLSAATGLFNLRGLPLAGSAHGHLALAWPGGKFGTHREGGGETIVTPPSGVNVATEALPEDVPAPVTQPRDEFDPYVPFDRLPLGASLRYHFDADGLAFDRSWVATPTTYVSFDGRTNRSDSRMPFHVTSTDWQSSSRLLAGVMTAVAGRTGAVQVAGHGTFDGVMTKSFNNPRIEGRFAGGDMTVWDVNWGDATGDIVLEDKYVDVAEAVIGHPDGRTLLAKGRFSMGYRADASEANPEIDASIRLAKWPMADLRRAFDLGDWPVDGTVALADLTLRGPYVAPVGRGPLVVEGGEAWGERFERAAGNLEFYGRGVRLNDLTLNKSTGIVRGSAEIGWDKTYGFDAAGSVPVESLDNFRTDKARLSGLLEFRARGASRIDAPRYEITGTVQSLFIGDRGVGFVSGSVEIRDEALWINTLDVSSFLDATASGRIALNDTYDASLTFTIVNSSIHDYLPFFEFGQRISPYTRAVISGRGTVTGPLANPSQLSGRATIHDATITLLDYELKNSGDIVLALDRGRLTVGDPLPPGATAPPPVVAGSEPRPQLRLAGQQTNLTLTGTVSFPDNRMDLLASGEANLAILQTAEVRAGGGTHVVIQARGPLTDPTLDGYAEITDGRFEYGPLTHQFSQINGRVTLNERTIRVEELRSKFAGGDVRIQGDIILDQFVPSAFALQANTEGGQPMALLFPDGFRSVVHANLDLSGPISDPLLEGEVEVLRVTSLPRPGGDTGILAAAAGSVAGGGAADLGPSLTGLERSGFPLRYNIHIEAPPRSLVFENRAVEARFAGSGDLTITGTYDRPVILGYLRIDEGGLNLSGNRIQVTSGTIEFYDPTRLRPYFDVHAEARVRALSLSPSPSPVDLGQTFHVTLGLSGTFDHITMNATSDPWLSEYDIARLLLGASPDVRTVEQRALGSSQQAPTQVMQLAAAQILTSPISSTLGGVVESAIPGSSVSVTPQLVGSSTALEQLIGVAKLVYVQRLSDKLYLTYTRTISTLQNDIILIEYQQNDRLSWVLSRNEDRSFALDFRIRHVF